MAQKSLSRLVEVFNKKSPLYDEDQLIFVNQVIGKAALIYEKVRNAIDYREDHLLRKNALYRILKRKLYIEKILINHTEEKLAEQIIQEMIRAGYLKNNQEPKSKIKEVQTVIEKYNYFISHASLSQKDFSWVLELEACEIEETLVSAQKEKELMRFAFETMNHRIVSNKGEIDDNDKELQVYLAINRSLRKADEGMLRYMLWNMYYSHWKDADASLVIEVAKNFEELKAEIETQINHPWRKSLDKIFRRWAIVFWTVRDIIEEKPTQALEIFSSADSLELTINKVTEARYKSVRKKLRTGVIRSIIYVFFTKMIMALLLELPLDMIVAQHVNYMALGINILFPPVLMFFVAITIKTPSKKNTQLIISEIKSIILRQGQVQEFNLKPPHKRTFFTSFILNVLYLCVFVFLVYLIFKGLYLIDFNWVSATIFIFFLSVVSFFGIRIRKPVKEIMIEIKRDNIFTLLIDFVSLPFATFGRWTSVKFSKINFVAFIFDFIIEAPFKIFIEVLEDLFGFWREKKEEAYD